MRLFRCRHTPEAYSRVGNIYTDGIDRIHADIRATCSKCDKDYLLTKIHIPKDRVQDIFDSIAALATKETDGEKE